MAKRTHDIQGYDFIKEIRATLAIVKYCSMPSIFFSCRIHRAARFIPQRRRILRLSANPFQVD
ncbi:hypothetical protein BLAT2472_30646 [Burkholderia latens]